MLMKVKWLARKIELLYSSLSALATLALERLGINFHTNLYKVFSSSSTLHLTSNRQNLKSCIFLSVLL